MFERENEKLIEFQEKLGYDFKDLDLLRRAFTTKQAGNESKRTHYDTLETLGDAVIKIILITRKIKNDQETINPDTITKTKAAIENNSTLVKIAEDYFNLSKFIFKSKNQDLSGKDKKILADVFEAICGAIYLDKGNLEIVEEKIIERFYDDWDSIMDSTIFSKSLLNEHLQKKFNENPIIEYEYEKKGPQEDLKWRIKGTTIYFNTNKARFKFKLTSDWYKKQNFAEQHVASIILNQLRDQED